MGIRDIRHTRYSQILIAAGRQEGRFANALDGLKGIIQVVLYPGSEIVALHTVETTKGEELVRQVDS